MRVCFDSRPAADPRGIGRYTRCLLAGLQGVAAERDGEVVEGRQPRRGDDLFHAPWMAGALLHPRVPMVVTVHDLVTQKHLGQTLRAGLRGGMRRLAIERAARVICPTRAVAEDAARLMRVAEARIEVIAEAPADAFHPRPAAEVAAARESHGVPEDYLLWVGDLRHPDPHRRVGALAQAPRELPLVLVGAAGPWAHELDGGVIVTGEVPDDELAALYTGAHALVLPSPEEGFGLPGDRGAGVRDAGRRGGRAGAAGGARRARDVRGGRRPRRAPGRRLRGAAARSARRRSGRGPTPPAATWDVYERRRSRWLKRRLRCSRCDCA